MRVAVAVWAAFLLATACASQPAAPSPTQVLATRLAAFVAAKSAVLDGTVSMQNVTYQVTLQEGDSSGVNGSVTVGGKPVGVTWTGGQLYVQSADYVQAQRQLYTGKRWVLYQDATLTSLISALADRKQLAGALTSLAGPHVSQRAGEAVDGKPTTQLASDLVTVTVPAAGGPPVRLATALDQRLSDGLADLKLHVVTSDAPLPVVPPPGALDLGNRNSLPARFAVDEGSKDAWQWDKCDARGCTISVMLRNSGGRLGSAHAMISVTGGGKEVGSCTFDIQPTDSGETVRQGCRVNYDTSQDVTGNVGIDNPV
jgi:hypothetical protein